VVTRHFFNERTEARMGQDQEVLYVGDLAKLLGLTEAAVRGHYYRRSGAIPKGFKMGAKLAWRRASVLAFLEERERKAR
jgi:predicted DNA-binding transcriptional regulator AlpA